MYTTTNYGFNIVEGTDMVNPLTQLNPNFTALDTDLKAVSDNTVDNATCIKTGTVHAVTRTNTSANVFRFTATGNWNTGDTMTVDGTLVSVFAPDGTAPSNGCFVINTEVLAAIQGTRVTLYVNTGSASNISFDDTSVSYTANNVQTAIEEASTASGTEYSTGVSVYQALSNKIGFVPINVGGTQISNNEDGWYSADIVIDSYLPAGAIPLSVGLGAGSVSLDVFFDIRRTGSNENRIFLRCLTSKTVPTNRTLNVYYYMP